MFGWYIASKPTLIAGAIEEQHNVIRFEKIEHMALVSEEVKKDKPKEKTIVKQAKNRFSSNKAELSNIPKNQGSCFDYVDKYASKYNVDNNLMRRIIKAESGGNPNAKNKTSTASGCAQFIKATWAGTLKQMNREYITPFDAETNVEALAWKISRGGLRAWDASKSKWSK
jgi:soluble lytic murein transglycosylase-like protein